MNIDKLPPSFGRQGQTASDLLFWAVIEHYRSWSNFDGPLRVTINNEILTASHIRRIGKEYFVIRGIRSDDDQPGNTVRLQAVADQVNTVSQQWPDNLVDRACQVALCSLATAGFTNGLQLSAFSKFIWFLRPTGWTMFDSLASKGVRLQSQYAAHFNNIIDLFPNYALTNHQLKVISRFISFYNILENHGFHDATNSIDAYFHDNIASGLFGERVIDKYLMFVGSSNEDLISSLDFLQAWILTQPSVVRDELLGIANQIADNVSNHEIFEEFYRP